MFSRMVRQLWCDQSGGIITAELTLVMSVLVLGLVSGLQSRRSATVGELENIAGQISAAGGGIPSRPQSEMGQAGDLVVGGRFDVPIRGGQFRSMYEGQVYQQPQGILTADSEYWARAER